MEPEQKQKSPNHDIEQQNDESAPQQGTTAEGVAPTETTIPETHHEQGKSTL